MSKFIPLDIVRLKSRPGLLGMITVVSPDDGNKKDGYSIKWFGAGHSAWFSNSDLEYVDNLPKFLMESVHDNHCSSQHLKDHFQRDEVMKHE